jgi:hypothetical protein
MESHSIAILYAVILNYSLFDYLNYNFTKQLIEKIVSLFCIAVILSYG